MMTNEKRRRTELTNYKVFYQKTDKSWIEYRALTKILAYRPTLMGRAMTDSFLVRYKTASVSRRKIREAFQLVQ